MYQHRAAGAGAADLEDVQEGRERRLHEACSLLDAEGARHAQHVALLCNRLHGTESLAQLGLAATAAAEPACTVVQALRLTPP